MLLGRLSNTHINFDVGLRLQRQAKLIYLSRSMFPTEIVEEFDKTKDEYFAQSHIHPQNWNMNSLLEGTKYIKIQGKPSSGTEASIFKEMDKISKHLF